MGDYAFALWNHLNGSISKEEIEVYEDELGGNINSIRALNFFSYINGFVLLNDEPANCKYRVENIRKNDAENNIPLDYYEMIYIIVYL